MFKVVSNYTPEGATDVPVIGLYYILNIFLLAVWLAATVGVLNFHFRGHKVTSVPNWVKCMLFIQSKNLDIIRLNEVKINNHSSTNNNNNINHTTKQIRTETKPNVTNLDKILKIMKVYIHKLDKNSIKSKHAENVSIEWKEVARRIDMILCLLVTITVTALPMYLFGKFMRNDHFQSSTLNRVCGCF